MSEYARNEIFNIHDYDIVTKRLKRAKIFKKYLDTIWLKYNLQDNTFNWNEISYELDKDIPKIRGRIIKKLKKS